MNVDEIGGVCSRNGSEGKYERILVQKTERGHLVDLGTNWRILLIREARYRI
jgi:hypothetical protein